MRIRALPWAALAFMAPVFAAPITFTISATATGTIGSTPFTDATLTITQATDTAGIMSQPCGASVPCTLESTSNTVTISGVGMFTIPENTFFFNNGGVIGVNKTGGADLLDESSASFTGYDMLTSLGPITGSIVNGNTISGLGTSGGSLSATFSGEATFQAVLSSTSAPEPASWGLLLLGGIPVARRVLRRKA